MAAVKDPEEESKDEVLPNYLEVSDEEHLVGDDLAVFEKHIGEMIVGNWSKNGEQVGSKASPIMQMAG